jgi:hypothetical protein
METIDTLIQDFKSKGWNDEQIKNVLEVIAVKPDELRKLFGNLIYFFARLPMFEETGAMDCYGTDEYRRLIHFAGGIVQGIENEN